MCAAIKSVNPNDKSTSQTGDFALARNELQSAWQSLKKMYENESAPLEALIDWLQAEQQLEMMRLLARHPQEGTAWEDAYKQCIARQGTSGGGLTLEVTEKYATEAMNRSRVLRWKKLLTSTHVSPSSLSPPASLAHARSSEQISLLQTPPEMRTPTHRRKYRSPTRWSTSCASILKLQTCRGC